MCEHLIVMDAFNPSKTAEDTGSEKGDRLAVTLPEWQGQI